MSKKLPAIQFYTGDWLKDPELSLCSATTRGIWMDLLCRMHESGHSGIVKGTIIQLCRLCRATPDEMTLALSELAETTAAIVNQNDGIYTVVNRRMRDENKERLQNTARVQKFRKGKNVTNCNGDVINEKTPVNVDNTEDKKLKRDCNENVMFPSSFSSSFSNTSTVKSGSGGTREACLPPAAFVSEIDYSDEPLDDFLIRQQTEFTGLDIPAVFGEFKKDCLTRNLNPAEVSRDRLEKFIRRKDFLRRMQIEFPQHDVPRIYRDFAAKCGSADYPKLRNNEPKFYKWLCEQHEDYDEINPILENEVYRDPFTGKTLGE